jgi:aspartate 1-decarboxylase
MDAADLVEHEQVHVYDITNGARLTTYVISGEAGSGSISINGAAAHLIQPGDLVIVASYAEYDDADARGHRPSIVLVDGLNRPVSTAVGAVESCE